MKHFGMQDEAAPLQSTQWVHKASYHAFYRQPEWFSNSWKVNTMSGSGITCHLSYAMPQLVPLSGMHCFVLVLKI